MKTNNTEKLLTEIIEKSQKASSSNFQSFITEKKQSLSLQEKEKLKNKDYVETAFFNVLEKKFLYGSSTKINEVSAFHNLLSLREHNFSIDTETFQKLYEKHNGYSNGLIDFMYSNNIPINIVSNKGTHNIIKSLENKIDNIRDNFLNSDSREEITIKSLKYKDTQSLKDKIVELNNKQFLENNVELNNKLTYTQSRKLFNEVIIKTMDILEEVYDMKGSDHTLYLSEEIDFLLEKTKKDNLNNIDILKEAEKNLGLDIMSEAQKHFKNTKLEKYLDLEIAGAFLPISSESHRPELIKNTINNFKHNESRLISQLSVISSKTNFNSIIDNEPQKLKEINILLENNPKAKEIIVMIINNDIQPKNNSKPKV